MTVSFYSTRNWLLLYCVQNCTPSFSRCSRS